MQAEMDRLLAASKEHSRNPMRDYAVLLLIVIVFPISVKKSNCKSAPAPSQYPVEVRFSAPCWLRRSVFRVAI